MTAHRVLRRLRPSPTTARLLGGVAVAALVAVFAHVVQGAVRQGEARRVSADAQALAQSRCKAERQPASRRDCVARVSAAR